MPKTVAITTAFTSGVLSPSAYGRTDIAKYNQGMSCITNLLPDPLGGLKRRPGTRFVCETKFSQFQSRLLPFEPNSTSQYMLEVGCEYFRFYKSSAIINVAPELFTNGNFNSDLSGWTETESGGATVSWSAVDGGRAAFVLISGGPGTASLRQDVGVSAGVEYQISWEIPTNNSTGAFLRIGSSSGGGEYYSVTGSNVDSGTLRFTATSATLSFTAGFTASGLNSLSLDTVTARQTGPIEVTTPYNFGEVHDIDTVQSADEMYFLHDCHITRKLQRYGDTCWRFNCVTWSPAPTIEFGARVESSISISCGHGSNRTVTAFNNAPAFLDADVDREIQVTSGVNAGARAGIKSITNGMSVLVNICVDWVSCSTLVCAGQWKLSGSPLTVVTPDDVDPVGKNATLCTSSNAWRGGGRPGETDVGKTAIINSGFYLLTCVVSANTATATIQSIQTGTTGNINRKGEKGAWTLEEPLWSCTRGYASAGDFHNDRLYLNAASGRFVASKSSDFENFATGPNDDDALNFQINSKTITTIEGLVGGKDLQLFTRGGEHVATSEGAVITPTDILVSRETTHGASGIVPIPISGRTTLFVDRSRKRVLEFTVPADAVSDQYVAPDLLLLAEHLTADTQIHEMVYQRKPEPIVWLVLESGVMLSCTYRREENVVAWAQHTTTGTFESVGVMPHPDGDRDQVWVVVNRTINGSTVRYVEYLDDSTLGPYDRRYTDSSVTYACTSLTRLTGLSHLECATVQILANGRFLCSQVVAGGQVKTADSNPAEGPYEVGLGYISEAITLQPEVNFGAGSIQFQNKMVKHAYVMARNSCYLQIRVGTGSMELLCTPKATLGQGVVTYDALKLSDFHDASITVRQEYPQPAHLLTIGALLDVSAEP